MRVRSRTNVDTKPTLTPAPLPAGEGFHIYIKNAVITKSSASVAIEENTTVRVVA